MVMNDQFGGSRSDRLCRNLKNAMQVRSHAYSSAYHSQVARCKRLVLKDLEKILVSCQETTIEASLLSFSPEWQLARRRLGGRLVAPREPAEEAACRAPPRIGVEGVGGSQLGKIHPDVSEGVTFEEIPPGIHHVHHRGEMGLGIEIAPPGLTGGSGSHQSLEVMIEAFRCFQAREFDPRSFRRPDGGLQTFDDRIEPGFSDGVPA